MVACQARESLVRFPNPLPVGDLARESLFPGRLTCCLCVHFSLQCCPTLALTGNNVLSRLFQFRISNFSFIVFTQDSWKDEHFVEPVWPNGMLNSIEIRLSFRKTVALKQKLMIFLLFQIACSGQDGGATSHHRDHHGHQTTQGEHCRGENQTKPMKKSKVRKLSTAPLHPIHPGRWLSLHDTRSEVEAVSREERDVQQ